MASQTLLLSDYIKSLDPNVKKDKFAIQKNINLKLGVYWKYNPQVAIFYADSDLEEYNYYQAEANGLILEFGTWKPLMVPPKMMIKYVDKNYLENNLDNYQIYEVEDGTIINFYQYDNRWVFSTRKGFDMAGVGWLGMSYLTALHECLQEYGLSVEEFFAKLNKEHCYTFGIKHPNWHKFKSEKKIWFVQSVNLCEKDARYLHACDLSPFDIIPGQKFLTKKIKDVNEIFESATNAYREYEEKKDIRYGYILRSKNYEKGFYDVLIESSLYASIKRFLYDKPDKKELTRDVVLEYFMSYDAQLFVELYPKYKPSYTIFMNILNQVISKADIHAVDSDVDYTEEYKDTVVFVRLNADTFKTTVNALNNACLKELKACKTPQEVQRVYLNPENYRYYASWI